MQNNCVRSLHSDGQPLNDIIDNFFITLLYQRFD